MVLPWVLSILLFKGTLCASYPLFRLKSSFIAVALAILPLPDTHSILLKTKQTKSLNVFLLKASIQPDQDKALSNPSRSPFNPTSL